MFAAWMKVSLHHDYSLLSSGLGEPLDGRLRALVGGVEAGESAEERRNDGDDATAVSEVLGGVLDEEEVGLGVGVEHVVVLLLRDVGQGLLEHLADSVDGDVELLAAEAGEGVREEPALRLAWLWTRRAQLARSCAPNSLVNSRLRAHVSLDGDGLDTGVLELLERLFGIVLGAGRVVVDRDVGAALGQGVGDKGAEVLSCQHWCRGERGIQGAGQVITAATEQEMLRRALLETARPRSLENGARLCACLAE